jgi:hypothetical protein
MRPEDLIASRDDAAARLLEIAREAELMYERLTSSWAEVPLAVDDPFVHRVDVVEITAWRAFVQHVRLLAGESSLAGQSVAGHRPPAVRDDENQGVRVL